MPAISRRSVSPSAVCIIPCLAALLVGGICACPAPADDVLLFDDFDGGALDAQVWGVGDWWISTRSKLGAQPILDSEGGTSFVSMTMDTYHPEYPGSFFLCSEIYSHTSFARGKGLELEARVRVLDVPSGAVCSFFTFARIGDWPGLKDEIDFEILTRQPVDSVLCTSWDDWVEEGTLAYNDGIHHKDAFPVVPGYDYRNWNTYTMRWLNNRIDWYVNDVLVNSFNVPLPDLATPVRFNFWASGIEWVDAYDAILQPVSDPDSNSTYYYDIDYVRVTALDVAAPSDFDAEVDAPNVALSWVDRSDNEAGFEILRAKRPKGEAQPVYESIGIVGSDGTAYLDAPGKGKWWYKVRAFTADGVSSDSVMIEVSVGGRGGRRGR